MQVLAINSSLRREGQSKTELMLNHLVQGMREAGAQVEVVNLRDKKIKYCLGCFACMTKTPGRCVQQDDMTLELFPKWLEADLVVYATPLFHHTVNAPMKTFIERTWPVCEPFLEMGQDGRWTHPLRHETPAAVMLSVCGFLDESAFDALSHYAHFLFGRREAGKLVAEIYRPAAEAMTQVGGARLDDILDATVQAGRELVQSDEIAPETMARIKQPIAATQTVATTANLFWRTCIAEGVTPKQFELTHTIPRPDSIEAFMAIMPMGFNSRAAGDTHAILQFVFSGEVEGACYLTIDQGATHATAGIAAQPDLTIKAPFEVWMDITTGKADGQQMLMEGKYSVQGDIGLLLKMNQLFSKD